MKMIMVAYNEAMDEEVMEALGGCDLTGFTKMTKIFGKGSASGTHFGNDIWPGLNNILYVACKDEEAKHFISCIMDLRKTLGKEGVKAFSWNLEELT